MSKVSDVPVNRQRKGKKGKDPGVSGPNPRSQTKSPECP